MAHKMPSSWCWLYGGSAADMWVCLCVMKTHLCLRVQLAAHQNNCNLLRISPDLLRDRLYGETEKIVAAIFSLSRKLWEASMKPTIVFMDEVDTILGDVSDGSGTEHEATRTARTLFAQKWDGIEAHPGLIIFGTTNHENKIPHYIYRRFTSRFKVRPSPLDPSPPRLHHSYPSRTACCWCVVTQCLHRPQEPLHRAGPARGRRRHTRAPRHTSIQHRVRLTISASVCMASAHRHGTEAAVQPQASRTPANAGRLRERPAGRVIQLVG